MGEQLPYACMSNHLVGLRDFQNKQDNWMQHDLAPLIWIVVNEELRARRQRRNLVAPHGNQGGGESSAPRDSNLARVC